MRLLKNHKNPLDIAPCSVRKSAITSAIETIGKLSSRKKLPPIVLQQRGIRRRAQKLAQVKEVAQHGGSNKSRPKPKHTTTHADLSTYVRPKGGRLKGTRAKLILTHSPIRPQYGRRPNRRHSKLQKRTLVGSSFQTAALRKKNMLMQYQF